MPEYGAYIGLFVVAFLLGSIPWGVIISRAFFHTDVREHGSGNIGTTNAIRTMGKPAGFAVFALDFGKGLLSGYLGTVFYGMLAGPVSATAQSTLLGIAFIGCVLGHIFSPWLGFKGGKGIAVSVGCLFFTFGPVGALIELAIFIVVVLITRMVSAGSLASAIACPILATIIYWGQLPVITMCLITAVVVIWAHRSNIERIRDGKESRIGEKKDA